MKKLMVVLGVAVMMGCSKATPPDDPEVVHRTEAAAPQAEPDLLQDADPAPLTAEEKARIKKIRVVLPDNWTEAEKAAWWRKELDRRNNE